MVLPVIAAVGARAAGSAAARSAATAAVGRGANVTRKATSSIAKREASRIKGSNITRLRRSGATRNASAGAQGIARGVDSDEDQVEAEESLKISAQGQKEMKKPRIGILTGLALIFIAVLFDSIELALDLVGTSAGVILVVIGWTKDIVAFFFFPLVFLALKVPPWKGRAAKKKMATLVTAWLISVVPWVGAFVPETVIATAITVYLTWSEDMSVIKKQSVQRKVLRAKRIARRLQ